MTVHFGLLWARAAALASIGLLSAALAVAQTVPPEPPADVDAESDKTTDSKATDSDSTPGALPASPPRDDSDDSDTSDAGQPKRPTPKRATDDASDELRETAREGSRDADRSARDSADTLRDTAGETKRGATRSGREAGDDFRDAADSRRDDLRDRDDRDNDRRDRTVDREDGSRDDARVEADFDVENVRSADVGLWFDRSTDEGLIINDIGTGAISRLGFREGDRIYSVNGVRVDSETDFVQTLFDTRWRSQRANVIIYRHGRPWTVYVQPSALVQEYTVVQRDPLEDWGLVLDDRYDDHVVVWRVTSRSPAYYAGFRPGDVITTFEGRRLDGRDDFVRVVQQGGIETANLDINRNRQSRRLDIDLSRLNIRGNVRTSLRPDLDAGLRIEGRAYGQIDGRPDRTQTRDMFPGSVQPGVEVRSGAIDVDVRGTVQPGIGQPGLGQPRYDGGVRGNVRGGTPAGARSGSLFNRRP